MGGQIMNKLIDGLSLLGIEADAGHLAKLETYIQELELWNSKLNLVSIEDYEQLIVRHVLDCLAGLKPLQQLEGARVADIGSGAGLPGLLLAIFMENSHFTLVERSGKKAGFLRSTAALLGMVDRVEVADTDLKNVKSEFDIVTLRAFRDFGDFYTSLKAVTAQSGSIAAYKARKSSINSDLKAVGIDPEAVGIVPLKVPYLEEERNLLLIKPWL
ncbi:MAG TPA: 16S rRNA (guanine(527)-N(7))-methyltransferase RsmG [Spirochaeta sp.]|nr:16S rRNA (guanine(527)-N(7))-methyltransferase RsmG [Spirochaeta sp.]